MVQLTGASSILHVTREVVPRWGGGVRFDELDTQLRQALEMIEHAYQVSCTAPKLVLGIAGETDLPALTRENDLHHAAQVDAGLHRRRRPSETRTVDWTIEYHPQGGFIARAVTAGGDRQPSEFRGTATTPLAAADLVAGWFTGTATSNVSFDPEPPARPALAPLQWSAELGDGTTGADGFQRAVESIGECYEQMRTACARTRDACRASTSTSFWPSAPGCSTAPTRSSRLTRTSPLE